MESHDKKEYKSKKEWKKIINELESGEFEELCYDLLRNEKFTNVKPRGSGGDGGRDLEGEFNYKIINETVNQRYWFQCKRYGNTPLNFKCFSTEAQKADDQGVDRFVVISNKDMSPASKTDAENWNKNHKCQISDWTGTLFLDILFGQPDICKAYFPDEEVRPVADFDKAKEIVPLSKNLGDRFGIEIKIDTKNIDVNNTDDVSKAVKEALLALEADVNLKSLIYEKSSLFFLSIGKTDDALMFINKSLEITPKNVNALLNRGYILEKIDKIRESNKAYDDILEIDSKNILALNNKSQNLFREGDLNEALKKIDEALRVNPQFIISIKNKVNILKALKKIDEALELLSKNEKVFEKSTDLLITKVDLLIEKLDLSEAFRINEDILKKEPGNINALNNRGVIYERNAIYQLPEKYYPLALDAFNKVITKDKNFSLGWSNRGAILMKSTNKSEAENAVNEAYELFPSSAETISKKGELLIKQKMPKRALKLFNSALKKHYNGRIFLNKIIAKLRIGKTDDALKDLDKLLKYEPENSRAWQIKGECLKKLRRPFWEKAFENAEKYKETPISLLEDEDEGNK
ncbi:tetratricopeptide repeat protein [Methanococcoides sp. SA1]|nr:tetratricopeptide repeat protein [Methanococcoides sp. SA1]